MNPKVTSEYGLEIIDTEIFDVILRNRNKYRCERLVVLPYISLGWAEVILLIYFMDIRDALDTIMRFRDLNVNGDFLFSTSFSHLFLRCRAKNNSLILEGETCASAFDAIMRISCKPGYASEILANYARMKPSLLISKQDIALKLGSLNVNELEDFIQEFRDINKNYIYSTKTDLFFEKSKL
jgi:hypothetical protein